VLLQLGVANEHNHLLALDLTSKSKQTDAQAMTEKAMDLQQISSRPSQRHNKDNINDKPLKPSNTFSPAEIMSLKLLLLQVGNARSGWTM
jgi:hypothetical protein